MEILGKRINSQPNHLNKPLRYLRGLFFTTWTTFGQHLEGFGLKGKPLCLGIDIL